MAKPTEFLSNENTEYTFFMKLSPSSQTLLPRPRFSPANAPTHWFEVEDVLPRLKLHAISQSVAARAQ